MNQVSLAAVGDWAFFGALVIYLLAFVLHALEFGATRRAWRDVGVACVEPAALLVTASRESPPRTTDVDEPDAADGSGLPPDLTTSRRGHPGTWLEKCGRVAVVETALGATVHLMSLVLRGVAAGRPPWGNMYEFSSTIALIAIVTWLVLLHRHRGARRIGAFVLLPVAVLMFLGGTVLYLPAGPVVPALQSYWLAIHVSAAAFASGILVVSGVASVLHVATTRARRNVEQAPGDKSSPHSPAPAEMSDGTSDEPLRAGRSLLPNALMLDRLAYRAAAVAFPIWTFAVIAGAIWAEAAWGRYWGWDPKETTAFVAWVIYAAYLHARATAGWRGTPAALINIVGLIVMLFNLFFVNLVVTGLHSYAGLR